MVPVLGEIFMESVDWRDRRKQSASQGLFLRLDQEVQPRSFSFAQITAAFQYLSFQTCGAGSGRAPGVYCLCRERAASLALPRDRMRAGALLRGTSVQPLKG